jgi:hypothetical protein
MFRRDALISPFVVPVDCQASAGALVASPPSSTNGVRVPFPCTRLFLSQGPDSGSP